MDIKIPTSISANTVGCFYAPAVSMILDAMQTWHKRCTSELEYCKMPKELNPPKMLYYCGQCKLYLCAKHTELRQHSKHPNSVMLYHAKPTGEDINCYHCVKNYLKRANKQVHIKSNPGNPSGIYLSSTPAYTSGLFVEQNRQRASYADDYAKDYFALYGTNNWMMDEASSMPPTQETPIDTVNIESNYSISIDVNKNGRLLISARLYLPETYAPEMTLRYKSQGKFNVDFLVGNNHFVIEAIVSDIYFVDDELVVTIAGVEPKK